ncbi:alanine or glycine:cation symporter, AGCS family [Sanguibacter gelidistatuariae]|uniref:Alanine or glycine:cation symporter, AGCS family n=1 Tax=Sanguibacter gelidistatuariae TaxID=1814289 RepID=A0A1G6WD05_9MICO|nr:alanine/glycine:cation symporter family protein [Sanguibacter gelidistatuariae]SDD63742.1 alanine or glycine:cation symporter, AGCS family [Sanguibacter gelidistatuariae]
MDTLRTSLIDPVSNFLYTYVLIYLLVGAGIYFTVRTRAVQVRMARQMWRVIAGSRGHSEGGISSFQAFCVGLASRVGTGNIVGVAIALTLGGPGAIFWMWVVAFLGMATAFIESTLGQMFKVRNEDGSYRGGPAYYIQRGLGSRPFAVVFALLLIFAFGFAFNMVQSNTISDALAGHGVSTSWTAVGLMVLAAPVLFGGVRRVASVAGVLLPIMAGAYVLLALVVVGLNLGEIPHAITTIINGAFGLDQAVAGTAGGILAALLNGVKRGLFSNEAGMGSAPNTAATATVSHPAKQGLIQSLGVFVDTMVVCSATAFMILVAGPTVYDPGATTDVVGASLTTSAIAEALGTWTTPLMTVLLFVFAFSSVLGNYSYAEVNLSFLGVRGRGLTALRTLVLAAVGVGSLLSLDVVWALADIAMALMAIVNLVAITLLGRWAFGALRDYEGKVRAGQGDDRFVGAGNPLLPGDLPGDIWVPGASDAQPVAVSGSV